MKTFKSDNTASVHPKVMQSIVDANIEHAIPYGGDPVTEQAIKDIENVFGQGCHVSFVLNGTGANIIGLSTLLKPFEAVVCVDTAHINVDECGAFERYTGAKLLQVPNVDGKLTVEIIQPFLELQGNEHHSQPRVISISQITEMGTLYSIEEIKALADFAHKNHMLLHVDGARLANAAVALDVTFKEMITDTGVDVLSFGAAKNGLMYGEAIVSFHQSAADLKFSRKQGMQLMSKMRYIAAQYSAILENELWKSNAKQANDMMSMLVEGLRAYSEVAFEVEPEGNIAFVRLPQEWIDQLLEEEYFYQMTFEGPRSLIRLVTSFDTAENEVQKFLQNVGKCAD